MSRQLISPRTRDAFRDAAVTLAKTYGRTCFETLTEKGIRPEIEPMPNPPLGELVEAYYSAVDWSDPNAIAPFIEVFEEIFNRVPDSIWGHRQELAERLSRDGLAVKSGKFVRISL